VRRHGWKLVELGSFGFGHDTNGYCHNTSDWHYGHHYTDTPGDYSDDATDHANRSGDTAGHYPVDTPSYTHSEKPEARRRLRSG
jgi:hypothetical protein